VVVSLALRGSLTDYNRPQQGDEAQRPNEIWRHLL